MVVDNVCLKRCREVFIAQQGPLRVVITQAKFGHCREFHMEILAAIYYLFAQPNPPERTTQKMPPEARGSSDFHMETKKSSIFWRQSARQDINVEERMKELCLTRVYTLQINMLMG